MDIAVPEDAPIRHGFRRRLAFYPDHPTVWKLHPVLVMPKRE